MRTLRFSVVLAGLCAVLAGCAVAPVAQPGLIDVVDAQYAQAEQLLKQSLKHGLASPRDRAAAHKHLAFIYCTSNRASACEDAFRAARSADPAFALSKAEAGHPQWGPVYARVRGEALRQ